MARAANATIDHGFIERWATIRGGVPARVKNTGGQQGPGVLRIRFRAEDSLEPMDWVDWFAVFEESELAFIFDDDPRSRFNKLISRDNPKLEDAELVGSQEPQALTATELLRNDHLVVQAGLSALERAFTVERLMALKALVEVHSAQEEKVFYPAARGISQETERLVDKSIEDHHEVDEVLDELDGLLPDDPDVLTLVSDLRDGLEAHIEEEEMMLFPLVEKAVNDDDAMRLAERMLEVRRELIEAPDFPKRLEQQADIHID